MDARRRDAGADRAGRALPFDLDVELAGEELGTGLEIGAKDTVPYCVWLAARFGADYEGAVWAAASQLGDRDTLAAITGGIVVCAAGVEAIPLLWREATEKLPESGVPAPRPSPPRSQRPSGS